MFRPIFRYVIASSLLVTSCAYVGLESQPGKIPHTPRTTQTDLLSNAKKEQSLALVKCFAALQVGQSEKVVATVIGGLLEKVDGSNYFRYFPSLMPYTNAALITEWKTESIEADGWPQFVFTVFDSTNKTSMIDALWYWNGNIRPIVDGPFNSTLRSIKIGDSMATVYRKIGSRVCEYYMERDGRWRVRFIYVGYLGRIIVIQVDAATGLIVTVNDGTI